MHEWPVLDWEEKERLTQRGKGHRELAARKEQPGTVA
jgi:hypothetical protein